MADTGNKVCVRRPNRRCAGDVFVGSVGVLQWLRRARCISDLTN